MVVCGKKEKEKKEEKVKKQTNTKNIDFCLLLHFRLPSAHVQRKQAIRCGRITGHGQTMHLLYSVKGIPAEAARSSSLGWKGSMLSL